MRVQLRDIIPGMLITILLLMALEIFSTALFPVIGGYKYRLPFNILVILFLGFKLETPFIGMMILMIQWLHSYFSVDGWAQGTLAGIFVCMIISYLRELIHFNSIWMTMLITQVFQLLYFLIVFGMFYLKNGDLTFLLGRFERFIPESIVISLLAPFLFFVLDKVWHAKEDSLIA